MEDRADAVSFATVVRAAGIPAAICSSLSENLDLETREFIVSLGVAPLQGIAEALRAIANVCRYGDQIRSATAGLLALDRGST